MLSMRQGVMPNHSRVKKVLVTRHELQQLAAATVVACAEVVAAAIEAEVEDIAQHLLDNPPDFTGLISHP